MRNLAALALLLGACSRSVLMIDGFPVGTATVCQRDFSPSCEQIIDTALAAFEERDPDHVAIKQTTVHDEDRSTFPEGVVRSGSIAVVVFDLADGTRRAVGAYCGPGMGGATCWPVPEYRHPMGD